MRLVDTLFMVVHKTKSAVIYAKPGQTAAEAWRHAVSASQIPELQWKEKGYVASRVQIVVVP